jgi:hypothetical protein
MYETNDETKTTYIPLDPMEMNKDVDKIAEINDLRNDIEYIKYVSTSTCVACNINMLVLSLFFIFI